MIEKEPVSSPEVSSSTPDKKGNLKKRVLTGVALVGGTFGIKRAIEAFSIIEVSTTGFMRPLIESHPHEILAAVFAVNVPFGVWSSIVTVKMLKHEKIGISPSAWANLAYYLIRKPSKARDIVAGAASRVVTLDWVRLYASLSSEQALAGVVVFKTMSTFVEFVNTMGGIVVLKTLGKKDKREGEGEKSQSFSKKGLVFDATIHRFGKLLKRS